MKTKFKIDQLAAKPIDVELVHPVVGKTGIFVKLCGPHSSKLKAALEEFRKDPSEDGLRTLCASSIMSWDDEAFGTPFSPENAVTFFKQAENEWVLDALAPVMMDKNQFFRIEDGEVV